MCYLYCDVSLLRYYILFLQYDESEDALCLDEEGEDISYLELLDGRFV